MNVAMLKTLGAIVDRGSFAAAAREVGCTPSAVSLQVKQLEAWFTCRLTALGVQPTSRAAAAKLPRSTIATRVSSIATFMSDSHFSAKRISIFLS